MATWWLRWNYNRETYQPGSTGMVSFNLENLGNTPLFVSDVGIQFEWMKDSYYHIELNNNYGSLVPPNSTRFITDINFNIPQTISGQTLYRVYYHLYEYDKTTDQWYDLGEGWSEDNFLNVFPQPYYKAFITRSLSPEDRSNGDEIVRIIKEWGFITNTVKFEDRVSDEVLREAIKSEILKSDCLISIATPRYLDALSGVWRTFPYLHGEVGIAFGNNYPILILVDNRVAIDGLPSTLKEYMIEFSPYDYEETRKKISAIMPSLRNWIANKKREEFTNTLRKIAMGVGLVIVGGIAGSLLASSKK